MENCMFNDVIEYFRSFQGESPFAGASALFVRFKKCNLISKCYFCDTKEKMLTCKPFNVTFSSVINHVKQYNLKTLTFTGGEPTLPDYADQIIQFIEYIIQNNQHIYLKNKYILIETNGYKVNDFVSRYRPYSEKLKLCIVWSPKLFDEDLLEENIKCYKTLCCKNYVDFVIKPVVDIQYLDLLESFLSTIDSEDRSKVYLMPKGVTSEELHESSKLASEMALKFKTNISPRLHIAYNLP